MALLAVEVAPDRLIGAIAEETAFDDRDLDAIEAELARPAIEAGAAASLALALGRAGRASSARPLGAVRARFAGTTEAKAIGVAIELLAVDPPRWLERGDVGYRRVDPFTLEELFIEDPLAAHWHHLRRWGPPLRAEPSAPQFEATGLDAQGMAERVRAGEIARVTFEARSMFGGAIEPALRLTRAGLTRDASLRELVRWSAITSVGVVERRFSRRAAYEVAGGGLVTLSGRPGLPVEVLVDLMTRLLAAVRAG